MFAVVGHRRGTTKELFDCMDTINSRKAALNVVCVVTVDSQICKVLSSRLLPIESYAVIEETFKALWFMRFGLVISAHLLGEPNCSSLV